MAHHGNVPEHDDELVDESWVVEFEYQIFASREEAERFATMLLTVVEPVVASVGRVEPGRIGLTSARAGQHDDRHSASKRQRGPGQSLYDVGFTVHGRHHRELLGDSIFHAVHAAGLEWEQMTETPITP
jgi:hypothetical protein